LYRQKKKKITETNKNKVYLYTFRFCVFIVQHRSKMSSSDRRPIGVAFAVAVLTSVCLLRTADGFESGSPVLTCRTMVPGHGSAPQTSAAPYRIVLSDNVTSSRVRVTLTAPQANDYFIGFLIEARVPGSDESAVGSFVQVPQDSQTLDCNEAPVSNIYIHTYIQCLNWRGGQYTSSF